MNKTQQIFVVGSGRSGTTMMGRILGNHSHVFTFNEIHFLGWLSSKEKMHQHLSKQQAVALLSELFAIQEDGIFLKKDPKNFYTKADNCLQEKENLQEVEVYKLFLATITAENNGQVACEQTPKNIFYINELLKAFPDAKFIHIVRDSRDVLLSQKNKWKRRFLGASKIPLKEAIRSYMNYHPITSAKFWKSAVEHGGKMENHPRVLQVKFENVLMHSEKEIKTICEFLGLEFEEKMLAVPNIGSSTEEDKEAELKIDQSKISKWKKGGLNNAEIFLAQLISKKIMTTYQYPLKHFTFPPICIIFYLFTFPIKAGLALLLNLKRIGNVSEMIKHRFG